MSKWTAGYAAEVSYTFGYFNELNPLNTKLALLDAGICPPKQGVACELGFGQGLSTNIHAAASKTQWFGTDFSPSQAGFAQKMAQACDNQAQLFDQAFAEFTQREDLPDFDFIGLHGTWTWVSDENRQILVDFISRKLKVGGVLYISYNTQAGWANMMPIRHLMNEHVHIVGAQGDDPVNKIQAALSFTEELLNSDPAYARANPQAKELFEQIKHHHPNYLAHEYFSSDWKPMPFSELADWLSPAKLDYVCSAYTLDSVNALNLSEPQENLIKQQPNAYFRETLRDLCVNQQFRKDYWVKGAQRLDRFEQMEQMMALRFVLTQLPNEFDFAVEGALGAMTLKRETYQPIIDFFADHQIKTLAQLVKAMSSHQINLDQIIQAILILNAKGTLQLAQSDEVIKSVGDRTRQLNRFMLKKARGSDEIQHLASPVTGGGLLIEGYEMLFLLALTFGHQEPQAIAKFSWGLLKQRGVQLQRNGENLTSDADNLDELANQVQYFLGEPLTLYRALGVTE